MDIMKELSKVYPRMEGKTFEEVQGEIGEWGIFVKDERELCELMILGEEQTCITQNQV